MISVFVIGLLEGIISKLVTCKIYGPVSVVRNTSDCRSRGRKFDPGPVPYFCLIDYEIIPTVIILLPLIQEGLLSVTSESMCTKFWLLA